MTELFECEIRSKNTSTSNMKCIYQNN